MVVSSSSPPSRILIPEHEGRVYRFLLAPWHQDSAWRPDSWADKVSAHQSGKLPKPLPSGVPKGSKVAPISASGSAWVVGHDADLRTHPGVAEGSRRVTLCKLVGSHLAKGDSPEAVWVWAGEWAGKCEPPFEDWGKHVAGLIRREAAATAQQPLSLSPRSIPPVGFGAGEVVRELTNCRPAEAEAGGSSFTRSEHVRELTNSGSATGEGELVSSRTEIVKQLPHAVSGSARTEGELVSSRTGFTDVKEPEADAPEADRELVSSLTDADTVKQLSEPGTDRELVSSRTGIGTPPKAQTPTPQSDTGTELEKGEGKRGCSAIPIQPDPVPDTEPDTSAQAVSVTPDLYSLPPDAYHGLFGEMLSAVEPETEAHPAGILLSWLTLLGNAVGREAWVTVGARRHYPNLFTGALATRPHVHREHPSPKLPLRSRGGSRKALQSRSRFASPVASLAG